jgi:tRNA U34 2-thiouridine synthase MnmA/TrmU
MMHVVEADDVNVLDEALMREGARLLGKVRSGGDPAPCVVEKVDAEIPADGTRRMTVRFAGALFAPTPGQKLVIYDERERVIAGGTICGARVE